MPNRRKVALFVILILLLIGFIWGNSLLSKEASGEQSGFWMRLLQPLLNPNGRIPEDAFHQSVRKAAHFAEFAVLGLLVGGLFATIGLLRGKRFWSLPVLMVLLVAVLDEYIQYFSDRGSAVTDVILDFSGGLTGLGIAALLAFWINRIRK